MVPDRDQLLEHIELLLAEWGYTGKGGSACPPSCQDSRGVHTYLEMALPSPSASMLVRADVANGRQNHSMQDLKECQESVLGGDLG